MADRIGQLIKSKAVKENLSSSRIASLTGVSESYAEHFVRNDRNFREDQLQKILPLFGVIFPSGSFFPVNTTQGNFISLPNISSPELMQIIGYFLGDGNLQKRSIRFKDSDKEVLNVYQRLIRKTFNIEGRVVPQKGTIAYLLEVNSLYLRKWFQENIVSRKKEFLEEVNQLPQKKLTAFLRGLFDAEGFVAIQSRQIRLGITNREIGEILPALISKLGIPLTSHLIKRREPNWKDVYLISLNNYASFDKFSKYIGFSSKEKNKRLEFLIERKPKIKLMNKFNLCVG